MSAQGMHLYDVCSVCCRHIEQRQVMLGCKFEFFSRHLSKKNNRCCELNKLEASHECAVQVINEANNETYIVVYVNLVSD